MDIYEYSYDTLKNTRSVIQQAKLLNNRSKNNWELISVVNINNQLNFYWKRKI